MAAPRGTRTPTGFGSRLAALREASGWSMRDLAARSGVALNTIARLERGAFEPGWPVVIALAKVLGTTPDAFLAPEGTPAGVQRPRGQPKGERGEGA